MPLEPVSLSSPKGLREMRDIRVLQKFFNEKIEIEKQGRKAQKQKVAPIGAMSNTSLFRANTGLALNFPPLRKIESKTEQNVIKKVFIKICERWRLNEEQQCILLGYGGNGGVESRILTGAFDVLSRDVEDRAGYVIGISLGLSALFQDKLEAEISWLNEPRAKLNSNSAIDYMLEGGMVNLILVSEMIKRERGI